jgi:arginine N-succinyltransferase
VYPLAKLLDSYNLPADRGYIRELLAISIASFQGKLPRGKARYLFLLEEQRTEKAVGCSLIIAKHGTPGRPHLWLSLNKVRKVSRTLGLRRSHSVLQLGYTEDGPTEVGGLVVLPSHRHRPEGLGLQVSYVRFLYMAMHPKRFEPEVLVEYRGAMGAGDRSPFWEAMGRVFTGLAYSKADRLSVKNKEFILNLFPREPIYCALLPHSVQRAIGAIHPEAERAARLLRRIGFRPIPQIEPFDGGPYYIARRREIRLIRNTRPLQAEETSKGVGSTWHLVGTEAGGWFRAAQLPGRIVSGEWRMDEEGFSLLQIEQGDPVHVCSISR